MGVRAANSEWNYQLKNVIDFDHLNGIKKGFVLLFFKIYPAVCVCLTIL